MYISLFIVECEFFLQVMHFVNKLLACGQVSFNALKVSKFQKQIFLVSFICPQNEQNYFLISALASKMGQIKKNTGTLLYEVGGIKHNRGLYFLFDPF